MMKTLQQIEPRTPIGSLPYTITNPGSFYLTADLVGVSGQAGILIRSSDVTLDLNGFAMIGVAGSSHAINVGGALGGPLVRNVTIMNGTVRNWSGGSGIRAWSAVANDTTIMNVRAWSNVHGISIADGTVIQCQTFSNAFDGIEIRAGVVKDSQSCYNARHGINATGDAVVTGSIAKNNQATGISVAAGSTVQDCTAKSNATDGINVTAGCRVLRNSSLANNYGIVATGRGNRIEENHTADNSTLGFRVTTIDGHNVVVKNSARNSTASEYRNYSIAAGNFFGPEIQVPQAMRAVHPENHPWANFSELVLF